jgi:hypothetical protein
VKPVRPIALCVAATLVCGVLTGCGTSATAPTILAGSAVRTPITKARAAAYAQAVNLRAGDLPEMKVTAPKHQGKAVGGQEHELATCDGGPNPHLLISRIKSPTFSGAVEGEYEQIRSTVEVQPTEAIAAKNDAVVLGHRGFACIARFLPRQFAETSRGRFRHGRVTVSRLPTPLPYVKGSFGIEIATTIINAGGVPQPPIPFYVDQFGFVSGSTEISLTAIGAPQPAPTETAERLMSLLYSRAAAHKL